MILLFPGETIKLKSSLKWRDVTTVMMRMIKKVVMVDHPASPTVMVDHPASPTEALMIVVV